MIFTLSPQPQQAQLVNLRHRSLAKKKGSRSFPFIVPLSAASQATAVATQDQLQSSSQRSASWHQSTL